MTENEATSALADLHACGFGGSTILLGLVAVGHVCRCVGIQAIDLATADRQSRPAAEWFEKQMTVLNDVSMYDDVEVDAEMQDAYSAIAAMFRIRASSPIVDDVEVLRNFVSQKSRAERHLGNVGEHVERTMAKAPATEGA